MSYTWAEIMRKDNKRDILKTRVGKTGRHQTLYFIEYWEDFRWKRLKADRDQFKIMEGRVDNKEDVETLFFTVEESARYVAMIFRTKQDVSIYNHFLNRKQ